MQGARGARATGHTPAGVGGLTAPLLLAPLHRRGLRHAQPSPCDCLRSVARSPGGNLEEFLFIEGSRAPGSRRQQRESRGFTAGCVEYVHAGAGERSAFTAAAMADGPEDLGGFEAASDPEQQQDDWGFDGGAGADEADKGAGPSADAGAGESMVRRAARGMWVHVLVNRMGCACFFNEERAREREGERERERGRERERERERESVRA